VTVRKWLAAVAVPLVTGVVGAAPDPAAPAPAPSAATPAKAVYGFAALRAVPADAAREKAEAWLKAAGKFDQARFDAVWADAGRPAADRTVESLLAGLPEAASAFDQARKADGPAPAAAPAFVADAKLDPFVRSNLAAAYAKALGGRKVYEECLEAAKGVQPEQLVDPAGFLFFKAVAEHALMLREAASTSLVRLLDDVTDAPDRYRVVATLMFFDLQNWAKDEKDLSNITKLMDNSGRRLDLHRGGPKTQDVQKKIVFRLDEKIKELENQCKGGQCNGGSCPNGGKPGAGSNNPSGPMPDSQIATNGGKGTVDEKKLRHYEQVWGQLPAAERQKVVQEITRDLPPKYQQMVTDYFRTLNRMHGYKDKP
jgi:hypothetical protein